MQDEVRDVTLHFGNAEVAAHCPFREDSLDNEAKKNRRFGPLAIHTPEKMV